MHPSEVIVTKRIKEGRKVLAEPGTALSVTADYNRIGGVLVLRKKSGKYICDYGSQMEKEFCKPTKY